MSVNYSKIKNHVFIVQKINKNKYIIYQSFVNNHSLNKYLLSNNTLDRQEFIDFINDIYKLENTLKNLTTYENIISKRFLIDQDLRFVSDGSIIVNFITSVKPSTHKYFKTSSENYIRELDDESKSAASNYVKNEINNNNIIRSILVIAGSVISVCLFRFKKK